MLPFFSPRANKKLTRQSKTPRPRASKSRRTFEHLEDRRVLSAYSVTNLNDSGAGSLRHAIHLANANPGADSITFDVAGTISITSTKLPTITGQLNIDGATAPGFGGTPVVKIDFNNHNGLRFISSASGSELTSLALVDSRNSGVTLDDVSSMTIVGNFIGLHMDGDTTGANRGDGITLIDSDNTTIGGPDADDCNVISANRSAGIRLINSDRNEILGNCIGVDASGEEARGNAGSGIVVTQGSARNVIGGEAGNVISGNEGNGILINGSARRNTVSSNLIGTDMSGTLRVGNRGDGIKLQTTERNVIGSENIVRGITYYNSADGVDITQPAQGWQGIRAGSTAGTFWITGTSGANALAYLGSIDGSNGTSYYFNYPNPPAVESTIYGPEDLGNGNVRFVGTYTTNSSTPVAVNGYMFEGAVGDAGDASHYRTINYTGAQYNYLHSAAGGLVVGNFTSEDSSGQHLEPATAAIYDISSDEFLADIVFPGSAMTSVYAIWSNGGTKYTVAGGYSDGLVEFVDGKPLGSAYMADFDSATKKFSNWKSFSNPRNVDLLTHFQGISSVEPGFYTLAANSAEASTSDPTKGSWVVVSRNSDGSFSDGFWYDVNYPNATSVTTNDSVYGNTFVGIVIGDNITYQATIDVGFQLSNVISGNYGNGISMEGSSDNVVAMNYIGTDISGTADLGNSKHGVLLTDGATDNMIGGVASGGNSPTNGIYIQPPQGNVISGNNGDGVRIQNGASFNQLSGNFIGVDETGNASLGNSGDGVAIVDANHNSLIGCTFEQDPFVYYNVISGNLKNGLRVDNSDHTIIQANFFGMGADNTVPRGNALNGVLVEGDSDYTVMGGPIPLGNVSAANGANGVYVRGTSSHFLSYNTFAGLAAFSNETTNGNGQNGFKITATGGGNYLRTNVASSNWDNGILIAGNANDVRITGNIVGMNSFGFGGMGNADDGIEVRDTAHNILIGGPQQAFNLIPQNTISDNGGNGIAIVGHANNITINCTNLGLDVLGIQEFGNNEDGIYLGSNTHHNTIGSEFTTKLRTVISANDGDGIDMNGSSHNTVYGAHIGTNFNGTTDHGNFGNGIFIRNGASNNLIGSRTSQNPGNTIGFNNANGVFVSSGHSNTIRRNEIFDNALLGIDLSPGANHNQAAPVLNSALATPTQLYVNGKLQSRANSTFIIEFFANTSSAPEGRTFLGSKTVHTNSKGVAEIRALGSLPPPGSTYITATATDKNGNTSEFSNASPIVEVPILGPGIYLLEPSW